MGVVTSPPGAGEPRLWVFLVLLALPPGLLLCLVRRHRMPRWQYVIGFCLFVAVVCAQRPASVPFTASVVTLALVTVVGVVLALVHQPYQGRRRIGRRDT